MESDFENIVNIPQKINPVSVASDTVESSMQIAVEIALWGQVSPDSLCPPHRPLPTPTPSPPTADGALSTQWVKAVSPWSRSTLLGVYWQKVVPMVSNRDIYPHGRDLAVISSSATIVQIKKLRFREEKHLAHSHVVSKGYSQGGTQAC